MAHVCLISRCIKYLHMGQLAWSSKLLCRTTFFRSSSVSLTSCQGCSSLFLHHRSKAPLPLMNQIYFSSSPPLLAGISNTEKFTMIYKFPGIKYCRAVSRLKLLQTALTAIFLPPMYYYYIQGQVTYLWVVYSTGTALFAGLMLYCLSFYLRRIIGMIYLNTAGTTLKVSHLTFWGKRKDLYIPIDDVKALSETGDHRRETILQFKRYSSSDTLYFTSQFGIILDKEKFIRLFGAIKCIDDLK
eukprot:XP_002939485.1 PREDICTED: transmembrane protein 186 [Xenopus tropicalis]